MKVLSQTEIDFLKKNKIEFKNEGKYSVDELFDIVEKIRDKQVFYSMNDDSDSWKLSDEFARIADKIDRYSDEL